MNRSSSRHAFLAVMITITAAVGCQKQAGNSEASATPAATAALTPEESFNAIVETFRRGVEDVPVGFIVRDESGGQTMMTGRNIVSHELIPPTKEGEPYKAVIKVNSESRYSLQRSTVEPDEEESQQASDSATSAGSDVQSFDPAVSGGPAAPDARAAAPQGEKNVVTVAPPIEDKQERKYELVYEKGRWKLVTKLDPKTEESIKFAFERALDTQS